VAALAAIVSIRVVVGGDAYLPDRDDQGVCDLVALDGGVDDVEREGVAGVVGGLE
jgi:hypothetical protein